LPSNGETIPAIVLSKVVFPTPDGPVIATTSPGQISKFGILHSRFLELYPIKTSFRRTKGISSTLFADIQTTSQYFV
jgi:hypothetical protein